MNKPAELNGSASTRLVCVSPSCATSRGLQSSPGAVDRIWRARGHHLRAARSRLKLAIEMSGDTEVYVLDEPTSGLHMHDIDNLIGPPGPAGRERAYVIVTTSTPWHAPTGWAGRGDAEHEASGGGK
jgi:hypothetical protein